VILSDQWTVRNYSSHEAWKPSPLLVQAPPGPPGEQAFSIFPADQRAALASLVCLRFFVEHLFNIFIHLLIVYEARGTT